MSYRVTAAQCLNSRMKSLKRSREQTGAVIGTIISGMSISGRGMSISGMSISGMSITMMVGAGGE